MKDAEVLYDADTVVDSVEDLVSDAVVVTDTDALLLCVVEYVLCNVDVSVEVTLILTDVVLEFDKDVVAVVVTLVVVTVVEAVVTIHPSPKNAVLSVRASVAVTSGPTND